MWYFSTKAVLSFESLLFSIWMTQFDKLWEVKLWWKERINEKTSHCHFICRKINSYQQPCIWHRNIEKIRKKRLPSFLNTTDSCHWFVIPPTNKVILQILQDRSEDRSIGYIPYSKQCWLKPCHENFLEFVQKIVSKKKFRKDQEGSYIRSFPWRWKLLDCI